MSLTEEQRACIDALKGPVDISAGAGSGKTFTLTRRIAGALKDPSSNVESIDQILAITFTNKAAGELKGRVRAVLRAEGLLEDALKVDASWISTIHGMCSRILRECALELGIDPAFKVIEEREAKDLLAQSISEVIGTSDDSAPRDDFPELFKAYQVSGSSRSTTISSMITAILDKTSGVIGGLDQVELGPPPRDPSIMARELLVGYESLAGIYDQQKQGVRVDATRELISHAIEGLTEFLTLDTRDLRNFSLLLDGQKLPARNAGDADCKQRTKEFCAEACAIMREAALGYGQQLLGQILVLARKVHEVYSAKKRHAGCLDNGDLMSLTYRALENEAIAQRYTHKFKLVMVDEFQDTDRLQIAIIKKLSGENLEYLCTVGDAQQSIYGFRGADVEAYHAYRRTLQSSTGEGADQATFLQLTKNFRSHTDVLAFVKHVCSHPQVFGGDFLDLSAGYGGEGYRASEPRIKVAAVVKPASQRSVPTPSPTEVAAQGIANHFERMHEAGHDLSEMVILLRSMTNADVYARAVRSKGFPCVISGGSVFSRASEVKLISYLARAIANREDGEALVKVLSSEMILLSADDMLQLSDKAAHSAEVVKRQPLSRGLRALRKATDDQVSPALQQAIDVFENATARVRHEPLSHCVLQAVIESGWMARLEQRGPEGLAVIGNILKAVRLIERFETENNFGPARAAREFRAFLESAKEAPGSLSLKDQDAVRIMTIHASKGLEFPLVVLADLAGSRARSLSKFILNAIDDKVFLSLIPGEGVFSKNGPVAASTKEVDELEVPSAVCEALLGAPDLDHYWRMLRSRCKTQETAEAQRLFYVAATRAKEALYISTIINEQSTNPLNAYQGTHEDLRATLFGDDLFSHDDQAIPFGGTEPLSYTCIQAVDNEEDAAAADQGAPTTGECGSYLAATVQPYLGLESYHMPEDRPTGFYSYSSLSAEAPAIPLAQEDAPRFVDADKATDFGSAFHRLAQLAALRTGEEARSRLDAIAQTYGIVDRARLAKAFDNWLESATFEHAMSYGHHAPEVPFCITLGDVYLEGEIDLLCYNKQSDQAYVVDYKTGGQAEETAEALQEKHLLQAQCYAYALLRNGFNQVTLVFARVEQAQSTVTYTFDQADKETLHTAIATRV